MRNKALAAVWLLCMAGLWWISWQVFKECLESHSLLYCLTRR